MQDAVAVQQDARPEQPFPDWKWSDRLKKWISPRASPFSGLEPPAATKFVKGDPANVARGSHGGLISARVRELIRNDDRILDRISRRWLRDCERGDNRAREQLLDRLEGKVEQAISATLTTRYVIEEAGTEYVELEPAAPAIETVQATQAQALSAPVSDNTPYDALRAGENVIAPMQGSESSEAKSGIGGADPDRGIPAPISGGPTPAPAPGSDE